MSETKFEEIITLNVKGEHRKGVYKIGTNDEDEVIK